LRTHNQVRRELAFSIAISGKRKQEYLAEKAAQQRIENRLLAESLFGPDLLDDVQSRSELP
jgi:hypothetical protein